MKESNVGAKGVKVGHYFLYDLDDRIIYSRIGEPGNEQKIKGVAYPSAKLDPLAFGAVVSDRRVYNPGETIRLLVASPGCQGRSARLEVQYAGKRSVMSDSFALNDYGVYLCELKGIDETGEYAATVTTMSEPKRAKTEEVEKKSFGCDFTVAQHTLSPLLAQVTKQVISGDVLDAEFDVTVLNQPYTGSMRVGLYCDFCKVVVEEKSFDAKKGSLRLQWALSGHTGPFRLEFSTPDGNTASVTLQSTRVEERQEIQVGNLGQIINVALIPIPDGRNIRGINWAPRGVSTAPVMVKSVESKKIELQVTKNLDYLYVYSYNPFTGKVNEVSKGHVEEGQEFSFQNDAPYQIVLVGCIINAEEKTLFEGRTVVFSPEALEIEVNAPERAEPGDEVAIRLESTKKTQCLLMVFDERLDTENITGKLGKDIYNHLKMLGRIEELADQFIEREERREMAMEMAAGGPRIPMPSAAPPMQRMKAAAPPPMAMRMAAMPMAGSAYAKGNGDTAAVIVTTTVAASVQATVAPKRAYFPKLLVCKLVEVDGIREEHVKLGDTITRWNVQVYAFADLDYISKSASIEADKSVLVDIDAPAMIDDGDECYGKAIYHIAEGKGTLKVRLPDGSFYEGEVEGNGIRDFKLPGPGLIEAELTSTLGSDSTVKNVDPQVSEKVTVSALTMLERGEELSIGVDKKVFLYGSVKALLLDSVRALVLYPYGCAEQTSAKLCGLAVAWQYGETSHDVAQMIEIGLGRMTKFLQPDGLYSLWEGGKEGSPDVTRKVLKNLTPLTRIERFRNGTMPLVERPVQELLRKEIKDNSLLPLSEKFGAPITTVEDAAYTALYTADSSKCKDALRFIESKAVEGSGGTEVHWEASTSTWGGALETTAAALRVLHASKDESHRTLFRKGFKFVAKKLVGGRLFSTADTRALVELFASLKDFDSMPKFTYKTYLKMDPRRAVTKTEKDYGLNLGNLDKVIGLDDEVGSDTTVDSRKLSAQGRLMVRVDGTETIEYKKMKSNFSFEVKLQKTTIKLGERVKLVATPKDHSICPITKIFLAANTAFLEGGANIQTISKPITEGGIALDIVATSKGKCKLYTVIYDMYDSTMIGIAPPIQVTTE